MRHAKESAMKAPDATRPAVLRMIRAFIEVFAAARAASSAVENGQRPTRRDLERLGINPQSFPAQV
jgi:hypothetical protein